MKKLTLFFGLITVISVAQSFAPKQDKQISVSMTLQEWEIVYSAIDDASMPGNVRKPLLQKIVTQVQAQTQPPKSQVPAQKQDSLKPKKN
jgi:hypothetical protein